MADYCWQCCEKHLGIEGEKNDLKGLCRPGEEIQVLCEGCGPTVVDHDGRRTIPEVCVSCTNDPHFCTECAENKQPKSDDSGKS